MLPSGSLLSGNNLSSHNHSLGGYCMPSTLPVSLINDTSSIIEATCGIIIIIIDYLSPGRIRGKQPMRCTSCRWLCTFLDSSRYLLTGIQDLKNANIAASEPSPPPPQYRNVDTGLTLCRLVLATTATALPVQSSSSVVLFAHSRWKRKLVAYFLDRSCI
ncbi:hypothetical protein STEG23_011338, partial [Scotinomys teguina]